MKLLTGNIFLLLTVLFCTGNAAAAEFYKWVDRDGVVHFYEPSLENSGTPNEISQQNSIVSHSSNPQVSWDTAALPENPVKTSIDATFSIKSGHNLGTGFFITQNGFAITCRHVVENSESQVAVLNDGREFPIGVISLNDRYDLALIMVITDKETPYLSVRDPYTMAPGDRVFAVGNYLGLQSAITDGLFTGLRKNTATNNNVIQFSAPANPGNSGGPLLDENGKVVGVVSWKIISQKGIPVKDEGFAVPSGYLVQEYGYYIK